MKLNLYKMAVGFVLSIVGGVMLMAVDWRIGVGVVCYELGQFIFENRSIIGAETRER